MKQLLKPLDKWLFEPLLDQHARLIGRELAGCNSVLDVGCGAESPLGRVRPRPNFSVGVDGFKPAIERSRAAGIHSEYVCANVLDIEKHFASSSFDAVLASDLIEHLEKADGLHFIDMLERIARHKVIIFTPNGFQPQGEADGNAYQVHRSGWEVEEMRARGYRVFGINGWKPLRGEFAAFRFRPHWLWSRLSLASQFLTTSDPTRAYQILCVKDVKKVDS